MAKLTEQIELEGQISEQSGAEQNIADVQTTEPADTTETEKSLFHSIKKGYVTYMTKLGAHIFHLGKFGVVKIAGKTKATALFVWKALKKFGKLLRTPCRNAMRFVARPFVNATNSVKTKVLNIRAEYKSGGIKSALKCTGKSLCSSRGVFVTAFNYLAPVVSIVFLIGLVRLAQGSEYGIEVEYNGESIGVIADESVYDDATKLVQEKIAVADGTELIESRATFSIKRLAADAEIVDTTELADIMLSSSSEANSIIEAYGFYISGECVGVVSEDDIAQIESVLEELLNTYKSGIEGEVLSFVDSVEFESGLYREETLVDASDIIELISSKKSVETYYTVVAGDAPYSIASKNNIDYEELISMNPDLPSSCLIGDKVVLSKEQPYLSVKTTYTENYDAVIPYETIEVEDSSMYVGASTILVTGSDGYANQTAEVTMINGYEASREVIEQTMITEPVARKLAVGTREYTGASASVIANAGNYLWPVAITSTSYVSSIFGYRAWDNSFHKGIDIPAAKGTAVYAAADGYVVTSKTNGAYGKCVVIDHGNGYQTWYAHNSSLIVSAGDYVKKGDLIALVGRTGSASGNHLHFEIRYNGVHLDPLEFMTAPVPIRNW